MVIEEERKVAHKLDIPATKFNKPYKLFKKEVDFTPGGPSIIITDYDNPEGIFQNLLTPEGKR